MKTEITTFEMVLEETGQDFDLPCDGKAIMYVGAPDNLCGKPSTFIVLLSCGCERIWCDDHVSSSVGFLQTGPVSCLRCKNDYTAILAKIPIRNMP